MATKLLSLLACLWWSLGFVISSQCETELRKPPYPGTPQSTEQHVTLVPDTTATFRLRYGTTPGTLTSFLPDSDGVEITAGNRGAFDLSGLTANTRYYYQVQALESGRWCRGWRGSFLTPPSTAGSVRAILAADSHYPHDIMQQGYTGTRAAETRKAWRAMASVQDAHIYIDLGDSIYLACHTGCDTGFSVTNDLGDPYGNQSVGSARSASEEDDFAGARISQLLRDMQPVLQKTPSIWVCGNHDCGGNSGDNLGSNGHWQFRSTWATTGIDIDLSSDLATGTGIFTEVGHGMLDGDGPYRWANSNPSSGWDGFTAPTMTGCAGARPASNASNEWYVDWVSNDTFRLAYTDSSAGCTGASDAGSGIGTLLRGSNQQQSTDDAFARFLPHQNTDFPNGWGAENHRMGPIPVSNHVLFLKLDPYRFTPQSCTPDEDGGCWPADNRSDGPSGGYSLGAGQHAGALATINEVADGDGLYEDVEILVVLLHSTLGGHGTVGYPYARGSLCNPDTTCVSGGEDCVLDTDCVGDDICNQQPCNRSFAHAGMEQLHNALDAMATRTNGIPIVVMAHDHLFALGQKDQVFYLKLSPSSGLPRGFMTDLENEQRYDFDADGVAAYWRPQLFKLARAGGLAWHPRPGTDNGLLERGHGFKGFAVMDYVAAATAASGKTEIILDWKITGPDMANLPFGESPTGWPVTLRGN